MRKLAFLALLAALATVPASAQTAPSPYETVTVTESFPGLPDETSSQAKAGKKSGDGG